MIVHKKTLAVSTAALLMTGGVAYAFINATSVSGSGSAGTATVVTELVLTPAPGSDANPFSTAAKAGVVDVLAENKSTVALTSPSSVTVLVSLDSAHSDCPANSYTATFSGSPVSVPKKTSGVKVGEATVVFNDQGADVNQSSCIGAVLTLAFSTP